MNARAREVYGPEGARRSSALTFACYPEPAASPGATTRAPQPLHRLPRRGVEEIHHLPWFRDGRFSGYVARAADPRRASPPRARLSAIAASGGRTGAARPERLAADPEEPRGAP